MNLPTEEECRNYFVEYEVPLNIRAHCLCVQKVAVFLARRLKEKGVPVDIDLVSRLAVLHDLFKVVSLKDLKPNPFHDYKFSEAEIAMWKKLREKYPQHYEGDVAYDIFKDDFPELARSLKNVSNPHHDAYTIEEKIVHYSDWRILREKVVDLDLRLDYLKKRYPRNDDAWERYQEKIREQEKEIFSFLELLPEDLVKVMGE